ncbi:hypothetical protein TNIN_247371 [Trichonephila inaurata madagascariensis]|uniref:Uncharacterized protein n=1 Tax=Trichonephila inaurata madagascariensis TaxID=2747483 RepID=A0A8X6WYE7_9ARAC|nr:hypothetical protein TNIN_247371 [Trichonephila inaurata madagascariensis]
METGHSIPPPPSQGCTNTNNEESFAGLISLSLDDSTSCIKGGRIKEEQVMRKIRSEERGMTGGKMRREKDANRENPDIASELILMKRKLQPLFFSNEINLSPLTLSPKRKSFWR